ncbi:IS66 family insertion sequence element accessory protein TnpB [Accumulibacter sp.]|nr:IS66 family insertion sequence element accessory protein TnpB [Accumulibacter sp.]MDS4056219.1 IS66 family insertion sequence element accessory protein TnpB [Accumulibacter sp.]
MTNRQRSRLDLVVWDGNGVSVAQRRLHRGNFAWPQAGDRVFPLTAAR